MSVIIRLQNLPWSANALDIRHFFKGLSIPEGGVHIVGGEMGDAFIAFSTDEDARQAMMHDREKIKEVQVRLLLSSRAEMQKVIETARLQSLCILQQMTARTGGSMSLESPTEASSNTGKKISESQPAVSKASPTTKPTSMNTPINNAKSQPPSFLTYQQQAGITLTGSPISLDHDSLKNKGDSSLSDLNDSRDRHESRDKRRSSTDRRRSRRDGSSRSPSHDRDRERSRDRERVRDSKGRNQDRSYRSRSREKSEERFKNCGYNHSMDNKERDSKIKLNRETTISLWDSNLSPTNKDKSKLSAPNSSWGSTPMNAYQTNQYQTTPSNSYSTSSAKDSANALSFGNMASRSQNSPEIVIPAFQNYTSGIPNTYSINLFGCTGGSGGSNSNSSDSVKPFVLQNPYTTAAQNVNTVSSETGARGMTTSQAPSTSDTVSNFETSQESIAFAKTNPYEQMYPNLFAQAAAQSMPRSNATAAQRTSSPVCRGNEPIAYPDSSSIKVSNMCSSTNYSDLRKFFAGLFIPHNGIKMVNDRHGLRIGVAFIQFSRQSSVAKAVTRNHTILKAKPIKIEVVPDEEFAKAEDSYRPSSRFDRQGDRSGDAENDRWYDGGNQLSACGSDRSSFNKLNEKPEEPYNVLFVEELPPLTTEQDLMKMFSSYTLYDILLMPSIDNRREYVAYVKFSRSEDAKAAYDDKSKHLIGYRIVRVTPGKEEHMETAKEKLRLANEQLLKEEQEEEEEAARNAAKLSKRRKENSFREIEASAFVDLSGENCSEAGSPTVSLSGRSSLRDPRVIPSLFDMPTTKPENNNGGENSKTNPSPADPRLRTRQRPSRFETETNTTPFNNANTNNNDTNIFNKDIDDSNNNDNVHPFSISNNQFGPNTVKNNISNNSNSGNGVGTGNGNGSFNDMFRHQPPQMNPMEENFVLLYNCPYNIRNNEVAELFISENLQVKHVEMLNNERGIPSGDFIVEVSSPGEANIAVKDFHNIQFHGRSLRVRHISPQEIADRLRKPFMNYLPGGSSHGNGGYGFNNMGGGMYMNSSGMRQTNREGDMNYNGGIHGGGGGRASSPIRRKRGMQSSGRSGIRGRYFDDDAGNDDDRPMRGGYHNGDKNIDGIPDKFNRPNCVLAMENVPYKADSDDILRFFGNYDLRPDDIIRRFNDEGAPTGDARVAFQSASEAREAFEKLNRKQIFNRTIFLKVL